MDFKSLNVQVNGMMNEGKQWIWKVQIKGWEPEG